MSKQHELQLSKEIEKMLRELNLVYINFKIVAAQTKDAEAINPLAEELKRIMIHIDTDVKEIANDISKD
jgi:hypothetical protein